MIDAGKQTMEVMDLQTHQHEVLFQNVTNK